MTEQEARQQIRSALDRVRTSAPVLTAEDDASVNYHIDQIIKVSGGRWDERIADSYITALRTEVDDELADVSVAALNKHKEDVTY
jgi:hypothetical protein